MAYEIILRTTSREYYIKDRRSTAPQYRSFDIVSRDEDHTVAPNRAHALEVAQAYRAWAGKFSKAGLAVAGTVVTRKLAP